ncbi:MAG: DUF4062 domain-containing protein [Planctomycetaceae bacterium]
MKKPGQTTAMLSCTARDLPSHRPAAEEACIGAGVFPIWMKHLPSRDANGIQVSLEMVDQADIYIGIFAWRYGWVPDFDNPDQISITEMEFNRALERKAEGKLQEVLIFLMHDDHPIKPADFEPGETAQQKLKEFKDRASQGRVVSYFRTVDELKGQIAHALAEFEKRQADGPENEEEEPAEARAAGRNRPIPKAPALYAEPDYIGSHRFVGRDAQLQELSDWAKAADPTNLLLFEAIGGNGKSMLTWEWTNHHAPQVRSDWAGRFWYSFYERGADMADFCQRALAYMTGQPLEKFAGKGTGQLREQLLAHLHALPWLFILDGLERVLVAYHRIDAAEVPDEEVNIPTDKIVNRDPCDAIRGEDSELLRSLAAARPSKILVSSRLTPRVLLNPSGQTIAGARRISLPGLRPEDAEKLLRSCGISGDSAAIQKYLTENCDNHPLVIGVLAGLIGKYLPARGSFDTWLTDPGGGTSLELGKLDIVQRRNHILTAAIDALSETSRQLLATMSLMSESVDYETLEALSPHIPPEPTYVRDPDEGRRPWTEEENRRYWATYNAMTAEEKEKEDAANAKANEAYDAAVQRRMDYLVAHSEWKELASSPIARAALATTVEDLEQRGFLQFELHTLRYDLHPVVRSVALCKTDPIGKSRFGQRVVDHCSSRPHRPYDEVKTLEDLNSGLHVVRTLLKLGRYQEAGEAFYYGGFADALKINLEAYAETLSLLRSFFPKAWSDLPPGVDASLAADLANSVGLALQNCGEPQDALTAYLPSLCTFLKRKRWTSVAESLFNIAINFYRQKRLVKARCIAELALDLARSVNHIECSFVVQVLLYEVQVTCGEWDTANRTWTVVNSTAFPVSRRIYQQGVVESDFAWMQFRRGTLLEEHLVAAIDLAEPDNNRRQLRELHWLRGAWKAEQANWEQAAESFDKAVMMARESRLIDGATETGLVLAKFHSGRFEKNSDAYNEAERLARFKQPSHRYLAMLWHELGEAKEAKKHALAAYKWAWADGEPYVDRYELTKSEELLEQLGIPIPELPKYDETKDEPFPWEAEVRAAIEKLRREKEEREKPEAEEPKPAAKKGPLKKRVVKKKVPKKKPRKRKPPKDE